MDLYALGQRTSGTAANTPVWEIKAGSSNRCRVLELGFTQVTAVAGIIGVGRPQAAGVTPTSPQNFVKEDDGNAPTAATKAAVAWGTAPTFPLSFIRRACMPATIGAGVLWTFPRGLPIPPSSALVVWNFFLAGPTLDVFAVIDE